MNRKTNITQDQTCLGTRNPPVKGREESRASWKCLRSAFGFQAQWKLQLSNPLRTEELATRLQVCKPNPGTPNTYLSPQGHVSFVYNLTFVYTKHLPVKFVVQLHLFCKCHFPFLLAFLWLFLWRPGLPLMAYIVQSSLSLHEDWILFSQKTALQFLTCTLLFSKFKRKILLTPAHKQNALVNCRLCAGEDMEGLHREAKHRLFLLRKMRKGNRVYCQGDCVP